MGQQSAATDTPEPTHWVPGSHIITREVMHGRVWTARPVTVVQDTAELIALAMAPGTIYKHPRLPDRDEVPPLMVDQPWRLVDLPWTGGRALFLSRPGDHYMSEAEGIAAHSVSRGTYREALRFLEMQGVIVMRAGPAGGVETDRVDDGTPR